MPMQSPQDLFLHELTQMHAFEQHNVETLSRLSEEVGDEAAIRPLRHHLEETREQVKLLEECLAALGQKPKRVTVYAAKGLQQDHDAFSRTRPSPELLTLYDLGAAAKIEHLEVAAYRSLIAQATLLRQREVAARLRRILKQEQDAVRELEAATKQLAKRTIPARPARAA